MPGFPRYGHICTHLIGDTKLSKSYLTWSLVDATSSHFTTSHSHILFTASSLSLFNSLAWLTVAQLSVLSHFLEISATPLQLHLTAHHQSRTQTIHLLVVSLRGLHLVLPAPVNSSWHRGLHLAACQSLWSPPSLCQSCCPPGSTSSCGLHLDCTYDCLWCLAGFSTIQFLGPHTLSGPLRLTPLHTWGCSTTINALVW